MEGGFGNTAKFSFSPEAPSPRELSSVCETEGVTAVSYTHLDVYKRQGDGLQVVVDALCVHGALERRVRKADRVLAANGVLLGNADLAAVDALYPGNFRLLDTGDVVGVNTAGLVRSGISQSLSLIHIYMCIRDSRCTGPIQWESWPVSLPVPRPSGKHSGNGHRRGPVSYTHLCCHAGIFKIYQ